MSIKIPQVIAHRGLSRDFPENSMAAFMACIEHNVTAVELDLQLSRDGIPVIFHDDNLQRIANLSTSIQQLDLAELQKIDIGSWYDSSFHEQCLPSYEMMLKHLGQQLFICAEIKSPELGKTDELSPSIQHLIREVLRLSLEYVGTKGFCILSFEESVLDYAKQLHPEIYTLLNLKSERDYTKAISRFNGINVEITQLNASHKRLANLHQLDLFCYCIDNEIQFQKAKNLGCDYFMSNRADWLNEYTDSFS